MTDPEGTNAPRDARPDPAFRGPDPWVQPGSPEWTKRAEDGALHPEWSGVLAEQAAFEKDRADGEAGEQEGHADAG